jgi:predicted AAA+ superfamily ATPase
MITREYWKKRIEATWSKVPIAWLAGVRRIGKTTLALDIENALYLNCDLPSVVDRLSEPELFFKTIENRRMVLDEVHQLSDPSRVLKIAADAFPHLRILATGSSTLAASSKFRDSLTGRKRIIHMLPVLAEELPAFGITDIRKRLLVGGLPQVLLGGISDSEFYSEWMDSYYARDVQELFRVEKRTGFLKLLQILMRQSGNLVEITSLAKHAGLSRPTVMNYIDVLQVTQALTLLSPYSAGGRREIIAQKKAYAFDTGFVSFARGWEDLRTEDCGNLWEHVVLETLLSIFDESKLYFWRDQEQREIDFVIPAGRNKCDVIECKWKVDSFDVKTLKLFRETYTHGRNFLITPEAPSPYNRRFGGLEITIGNAAHLRHLLQDR